MKSLRGMWGLVAVAAWCSVAVAQEATALRLQGSFATSGIRRYSPGKWGTVDLLLYNPTDIPISGTADIATADDLQLQFGRRFWLPPKSQRHFWLPLKMPEDLVRPTEHIDLRGRVLVDTPTGAQLVRTQGEQMHQSPLAIVDHEHMKTALLLPKPRVGMTEESNFRADKAHEVVIKTRQAYGLSTSTIAVRDDFLPPDGFLLEGADHVVLATDSIVEDSVGLRSLRQWLAGGGRLWIMLDMVSREAVKELLGGGFDIECVDRVQLNQVAWEAGDVPVGNASSSTKEFEYAVEMVRVVTDVPQVAQRVDGWPAAMLMPYGDGMVLLTTLEGRAWLDLTNGSVIPEMNNLAGLFFAQRARTRVTLPDLRPTLEELIGYQIPRRRTVILLLGGACLAMFGAAGFVWVGGRREWFAVVGPAVALITAAVFFGLGATYKHEVSSAMAALQIASYVPQASETTLRAGGAIYMPATDSVTLQGSRGGVLWPEQAGLEGTNKRLVWGDLDRWQWEELRLPAGIRLAWIEAQVPMREPLRVRGQFGPEGFVGQLSTGELGEVGDAIIVTPGSRRLGVTLQAEGRFVVNADQTLGRDQFTLESLLSDEQRRRRDIYAKYVMPRSEVPFPLRPIFLCWAQTLDPGMSLPESFERRGSTLLSVPLSIEPTPAGKPFFVPSAFSRVSLLADVEGRSAAFNPRTGEWTPELSMGTRTRLHFALPEQVLPAALERGQVTIKVNAPSRDVTIVLRREKQDIELRTLRDANGVFKIPVDQADQLWLDEQGGVAVGIIVGPPREPDSDKPRDPANPQSSGKSQSSVAEARFTSWTIDYVRLDVWGRTTEPSGAPLTSGAH